MFRYSVRSMSSDHCESEQQPSEKVPLVPIKFDSLAKLLFNRSLTFDGSSSSSATKTTGGPGSCLGGSRDSDLSSQTSR